MTSAKSKWFLRGGRSTEEEETSRAVSNRDDDNSSKEVSEEEETSSEEGNEEEEKSSSEGNEEKEKSSSEGNEEEEKSSSEGNEEEEKSSSEGNEEEEKSSSEGNEENSSEESDDENLLPHQRNNHVEYFKSLRSSMSRMHGVNWQNILPTPPQLVPPSNSQQLRTPRDKKVRFVETSSEEETESTVKVARKENNKKTVGNKNASKLNRASNECKVCDKTFSNPWNLSRHLKRIHGGKLSTQNSAPNQNVENGRESSLEMEVDLPSKSARKENNKKTAGDKDASKFNRASNECKVCDKTFANPSNLSRHLRRLHGAKLSTQNSAPNQNVDNGKESSLEMEVDLPSKSPPASKVATQLRFKCYRCSTWFSRLKIVRAHFKSFHPGFPFMVISSKSVQFKSDGASSKKPGEFNCGECGIVYAWKHNLVKHMRKSHGGREAKPKEAVVVTKKQLETSSNGNAVKRPAVINTNEYARPFKINRREVSCTKCGESFPTTRRLSAHLEANPDCDKPGSLSLHSDAVGECRLETEGIPASETDEKEVPSENKKNTVVSSTTEKTEAPRRFRDKSKQRKSIQSVSTRSSSLEKSGIDDSTRVQNPQVEGEVRPKNPQSYRCEKCGRSFCSKKNLNRHLMNKSCDETQAKVLMALNATLDFICQFCNKDMKKRSSLEQHVASCHRLVHKNAREYQHLDIKKGEASTIFFCPFCGLRKDSLKPMVQHFRANHKESFGVPKKSGIADSTRVQNPQVEGEVGPKNPQSYRCEKCGRSFCSKKNLNRHLMNKTCDETEARVLMAQKKTGSDSKDQQKGQCAKCGRWFANKWSLRRHIVKMSCMSAETEALMKLNATLDFICQFCNKDMKERSRLEVHIASCHRLVHENAREYQHLDIKKGEAATIFFCPFCGLRSDSLKQMSSHFRENHKESFGVPKKSINNV